MATFAKFHGNYQSLKLKWRWESLSHFFYWWTEIIFKSKIACKNFIYQFLNFQKNKVGIIRLFSHLILESQTETKFHPKSSFPSYLQKFYIMCTLNFHFHLFFYYVYFKNKLHIENITVVIVIMACSFMFVPWIDLEPFFIVFAHFSIQTLLVLHWGKHFRHAPVQTSLSCITEGGRVSQVFLQESIK